MMHDPQIVSEARTAVSAVRHGLTGRQPPPSIINEEQLKDYREQFHREHRPVGITESSLVDELARHTAMLKVAEQAEFAVLRHGSQLVNLVISADAATGNLTDAALTAAVSSDSLERLTRYRRAHERAFLVVLDKLEQIKALRHRPPARNPGPKFRTEEDCRDHLRRRFSHPDWGCPRCGHDKGSWLSVRERWECGQCHAQIGLRTGTIAENSPLPLLVWFTAFRIVAGHRSIRPAELACKLRIKRVKTVRNMLRRIEQRLHAACPETDDPFGLILQDE